MEISISKDAYQEMVANNSADADLYAEDEHGGGYALKSVLEREQGLRSALQKERGTVKNLKRAAEQQSGNTDELDALRQHAEQLAGEKNTFQEQLTAMQETLATLTGSLSKERADNAITQAVATAKGTPGLHAYLKERVKVDNANGHCTPVDPETGADILDADGNPLSLPNYVAALREQALAGQEDLAGMFLGSQSSGGASMPGGGKPQNNSGASYANVKRSQLKPAQKVAIINDIGHEAFMRLPW